MASWEGFEHSRPKGHRLGRLISSVDSKPADEDYTASPNSSSCLELSILKLEFRE